MQKRKIDELISYFNRKVADMDIDREYKMELLGMITAILQRHDEDMKHAQTIERKTGKWEVVDDQEPRRYGCSECKRLVWYTENYCPNCGARMEDDE